MINQEADSIFRRGRSQSHNDDIICSYWLKNGCQSFTLHFFFLFFPPNSQVFVSENNNSAQQDIDNFFNFADMQLGL